MLRSLIVVAAMVAACALPNPRPEPPRSLGPSERWLPLADWTSPEPGAKLLCAGVGYIGEFRLRGSADDPRLAWMIEPAGRRQELGWPLGYSARFTPALEILDENGRVVGIDGSLITGGCGTAEPGVEAVSLAPMPACRPCPNPAALPPVRLEVTPPPDRARRLG